MRVSGHSVTITDARKFFKTHEPLISDSANAPEMEKRLNWLSQGILRFCLLMRDIPEINESEQDLWIDFLAWRAQQKRCGG
jgi:hypothetical protein